MSSIQNNWNDMNHWILFDLMFRDPHFMADEIFPKQLGSIHPLYRAKNQGFGYCSSHLCTERVKWRCLMNVFLHEHARWFTLCVYTPKREKLVVCRCSSQSSSEEDTTEISKTKMSIPRKNFMKTLLIQSNQSVNLPTLKLTDIAHEIHENPHLSW